MNTIRLEIKRIEKQILALETEAAALLDKEASPQAEPEKITFSLPQRRGPTYSLSKTPNRVH